jgi:hypothetical protein
MKNITRIMRTGGLLLFIILVTIGMITIIQGGVLLNPGALNSSTGELLGGVTSHKQLSNRCSACHGLLGGDEAISKRCLDCHTDVMKEITEANGLHRIIMKDISIKDCLNCHTEHKGSNAEVTFINQENFRHEATNFDLDSHIKNQDNEPFQCSDCHPASLIDFTVVTCKDCHTKIDSIFMLGHSKTFGDGCLNCHDGKETYGGDFSHEKTVYPLTGSHKLIACVNCHAGATTIEDILATPKDCFSCHEERDVHGGQNGHLCESCHTPDGWTGATIDHAGTSFPLLGKHQQVGCGQCHENEVYQKVKTDCLTCHKQDDIHLESFGSDCAACHTSEDWTIPIFDHQKSGFPLTGAHQQVSCTSCHINGGYKSTPMDCKACHAEKDIHGGEYGSECATCHTPDGWNITSFDHSKTLFQLTGAHLGVACSKCHVNEIYNNLSTRCANCHAEPVYHVGVLGLDCEDCHHTTAWIPAEFDRQHKFPVEHGMAKSCKSCHDNSLGGYSCYLCHDQDLVTATHEQQGDADIANCVSCHPIGQ